MLFEFCGKQFNIDTGPTAKWRSIEHAGLMIVVGTNTVFVRNPNRELIRTFRIIWSKEPFHADWIQLKPGEHFVWMNPCATHATAAKG